MRVATLSALIVVSGLAFGCDSPTPRESGAASDGNPWTVANDEGRSDRDHRAGATASNSTVEQPQHSDEVIAAWWVWLQLQTPGAVPEITEPAPGDVGHAGLALGAPHSPLFDGLPPAARDEELRDALARLNVEIARGESAAAAVARALDENAVEVSLRPWLQLGLAVQGLRTGVVDGLTCPRALGPHRANDSDLSRALRSCWTSACPAMVGANDRTGFVRTLAGCADVPLPGEPWQTVASSRRLAAAVTVHRALRALESGNTPAWQSLRSLALDRLHTVEIPLVVRGGVASSRAQSLGLPVVPSDVVLDLGDRVYAGAWPTAQVTLAPSRLMWILPAALEPVAGDPVDGVDSRRRAGAASVGLLLPGRSTLREVRAALAVAPGQRLFVGLERTTGPTWLELRRAADDVVVDALIQADGAALRVWVEPERVSPQRLANDPSSASGRRALVAAERGLEQALIGVHDALADESVARLLLDLDDDTTLDEMLDLVHVAAFPRTEMHLEVDGLLAGPSPRATPRIDAIFVSQQPLSRLPLVHPGTGTGVGMPAADEIESQGPLSTRRIASALERLESALTHCHERVLRDAEPSDAAGDGMVTIEATVADDGRTSAVRVLGNSTGNSLLPACVEDGIDVLRFPVRPASTTFAATIVFASPAHVSAPGTP